MMTININILVNQQGIDISTLPPYNFTCICYFIYYIVISTIRAVKFIARLTKAAKWRKVRLKPVSVSIKVLMKCNYKTEKMRKHLFSIYECELMCLSFEFNPLCYLSSIFLFAQRKRSFPQEFHLQSAAPNKCNSIDVEACVH